MARIRGTQQEEQEVIFQKRDTMKLCHVPWMFVLVAVLFAEVHGVSSAWLSTVSKVALDQSTAYPEGMKLKAIYMSFSNNHSIYVQIWKPIDENRFSLKWQRKVHGVIADGMPEVIDLKDSILIDATDRVGIQNTDLPGPVDGVFKMGSAMTLSKEVISTDPMDDGTQLEFDELELPFVFVARLCNTSDCFHMKEHPSEPQTGSLIVQDDDEDDDDDDDLLTRGMIMGLIAWNIAITFILLIVVIAVISVCVDLGARRSGQQRRDNIDADLESHARAYDNSAAHSGPNEHSWNTGSTWKPDAGMDTIDDSELILSDAGAKM